MKPTALNTAVRKSLDAQGLPARGQAIVCALSGGADSVALLDALAALASLRGFRVVAAHLDHGLREGSSEDAAFCAALCERLGVELRTARADVRARAAREKGGIEQAARRERYAFLRSVLADSGAVAIAVGHTEDDQAETLLLRLLRGSGCDGLAAMRARSRELVRPLLGVSRAEVMAHLRARGLGFREDASNHELAFLRNRVRHELIPYLERHFNPRVKQALARSAALSAADGELLDALTPEPRPGGGGSAEVPLAALGALSAPLRGRLVRRALGLAGGLRGVTGAHVDAILRLAGKDGASGRSVALPGGRAACVAFDRLRIGPRPGPVRPFAFPLPVPGRVPLPGGLTLVAEREGEPSDGTTGGPASPGAAAPITDSPLMVRTRRPGDRVRVGGRSRSLKRHLIERRVPRDERERLPLVAAGSEVLWMPGEPRLAAGERGLRLRLEDEAQGAGTIPGPLPQRLARPTSEARREWDGTGWGVAE